MAKINYAKYMADFTPQREWVEGKGLFLVIAFFTGGIAGGLYLISLLQNFFAGALAAWLIVMLVKFPSHMLFLGHPFRFWRLLWRPNTSWVSRTMIAEMMFSVFPFLQLAAWASRLDPTMHALIGWLPWASIYPVLVVLSAFAAFAMITGTGFIIAGATGIQAWNTTMVPLLMVSYSFLGGTGLMLLMSPLVGRSAQDLHAVEALALWLLAITAFLVLVYLWTVYYAGPAAKRSVTELFKGRAAPVFIPGVLVLGLLVPIVVLLAGLVSPPSTTVIAAAALCELIGGFSMRYSLLKAGVFAPLV
ncbi:MAG: polysulfide reductase NrfD [Chloroflexi bacterium]|nr:polysulfide reductase NrfD [Chloroflexota bacterium]